jgi:hypothetical protein
LGGLFSLVCVEVLVTIQDEHEPVPQRRARTADRPPIKLNGKVYKTPGQKAREIGWAERSLRDKLRAAGVHFAIANGCTYISDEAADDALAGMMGEKPNASGAGGERCASKYPHVELPRPLSSAAVGSPSASPICARVCHRASTNATTMLGATSAAASGPLSPPARWTTAARWRSGCSKPLGTGDGFYDHGPTRSRAHRNRSE